MNTPVPLDPFGAICRVVLAPQLALVKQISEKDAIEELALMDLERQIGPLPLVHLEAFEEEQE